MGAPMVSPAPARRLAGAVPDHCLGVPHGVGEWSGTAEADPRRGSPQAGRTTGTAEGHTVATRCASVLCRDCWHGVRPVFMPMGAGGSARGLDP